MSVTATVERLTDIVIRQAEIIRELSNCLEQHNAVTTIENRADELHKDTDSLLSELSAGV